MTSPAEYKMCYVMGCFHQTNHKQADFHCEICAVQGKKYSDGQTKHGTIFAYDNTVQNIVCCL